MLRARAPAADGHSFRLRWVWKARGSRLLIQRGRGGVKPAETRTGAVGRFLRAAPPLISTLTPARDGGWPSVTTCSPACRPEAITESLPWVRATTTRRFRRWNRA